MSGRLSSASPRPLWAAAASPRRSATPSARRVLRRIPPAPGRPDTVSLGPPSSPAAAAAAAAAPPPQPPAQAHHLPRPRPGRPGPLARRRGQQKAAGQGPPPRAAEREQTAHRGAVPAPPAASRRSAPPRRRSPPPPPPRPRALPASARTSPRPARRGRRAATRPAPPPPGNRPTTARGGGGRRGPSRWSPPGSQPSWGLPSGGHRDCGRTKVAPRAVGGSVRGDRNLNMAVAVPWESFGRRAGAARASSQRAGARLGQLRPLLCAPRAVPRGVQCFEFLVCQLERHECQK